MPTKRGLRTVQRHVAGHSAVDKVSVCGTRITTLERSILNNAVKMPILSSFWDWKHFPRLKKRVQPGWQGARGNCIRRCDCVTCLPNLHLSAFSLPDTCAIVAFCRDIRGFSWFIERIFGIDKCGFRENSFGRGNSIWIYTWNCIISCLIKLFLCDIFFLFQCGIFEYFILQFESYIIFPDIAVVYLPWKEWYRMMKNLEGWRKL